MDFADMAKMKEVMGKAREMQAQMEQKLAATVVEAATEALEVSAETRGTQTSAMAAKAARHFRRPSTA